MENLIAREIKKLNLQDSNILIIEQTNNIDIDFIYNYIKENYIKVVLIINDDTNLTNFLKAQKDIFTINYVCRTSSKSLINELIEYIDININDNTITIFTNNKFKQLNNENNSVHSLK